MAAGTFTIAEIATMDTWSNCFNAFTSGYSSEGPDGTPVAPRIVNALELSWNMPYAIPNDNTHCSLTC